MIDYVDCAVCHVFSSTFFYYCFKSILALDLWSRVCFTNMYCPKIQLFDVWKRREKRTVFKWRKYIKKISMNGRIRSYLIV